MIVLQNLAARQAHEWICVPRLLGISTRIKCVFYDARGSRPWQRTVKRLIGLPSEGTILRIGHDNLVYLALPLQL